MSESLREQRLREIRERVDAAKNRLQPWSYKKRAESILEQHSRTDIPALLSEIERLKAKNARIKETVEPDCGHENAIQRTIRAITCPDCGACIEHWD